MRRYAVSLALFAVLVLCCGLSASADNVFAAGAKPQIAVPLTFNVEKSLKAQLPESAQPLFANEKALSEKGTAVRAPREQLQRSAPQMEPIVVAVNGEVIERGHVVAKELRAGPIHVSDAAGPHSAELHHQRKQLMSEKQGKRTTPVLATEDTPANGVNASLLEPNDVPSSAKHGTILSGGVIVSVTIALAFACFLLILVIMEMITSICAFVKHRRMVALHKSKTGFNPSEPKYGDFRDTAENGRS
ncbi:hypothetical protein ABL78_6950 [Leptomonas seymouri]|uniref:Transmembrane protein n=1 Tax=Leptomonas seymouri TaxID=5684 RepID=A0A0N0P3D8_LEPSE|nr:hypothetical protein ABL78_6950 [Leptomonas seymouri]|eukprot:KPI84009.1 hypothetical protein ABL78_6950 [Leptomonas seymouri]